MERQTYFLKFSKQNYEIKENLARGMGWGGVGGGSTGIHY